MDALPDKLKHAGLDASKPTFTIWEGVTMCVGSHPPVASAPSTTYVVGVPYVVGFFF